MANYTKGEWKQQVASNDNRIVMCGIYNIAQVYGRTHKEETEANAHLIAKAPQMAELLKRMVDGGWSTAIAIEAKEIIQTLDL